MASCIITLRMPSQSDAANGRMGGGELCKMVGFSRFAHLHRVANGCWQDGFKNFPKGNIDLLRLLR